MLKNIAIRNKLLLLFIPLILAVIAFGGYVHKEMKDMNDDMQEANSNTLPAIVAAEEASVALGNYRIRQSRFVMSNTPELQQEAEKDMALSMALLTKRIAEYEALMKNAPQEEKDLLNSFKNQIQTYIKASQDMMTHAKEGKTDLAETEFFNSTRTEYNKAGEIADKIIAFNIKFANDTASDNHKSFVAAELATYIFIGGVVVAVIASLLSLMGSIALPVKRMTTAMNELAQGNLSVDIPAQGQKDEIGRMAQAVQVFKENAQKVADMARQQEEADVRAKAEKKQVMQQLANNFESQVKNVVDMVASAATEMDATAKNVSHIAEDSQKKLGTLTTDVNQASENVDTVASATTQLSQAISDINRQISRASTITNNAVDEAQKADGTVQELVSAAGKIGEVIGMINSIAEQINLLALNATIEAARAGDAGKGFAVVASEVKALATQTTKATSEITDYVASIQATTNQTVGVIKAIITTIQEISSISTTIAAAVEEQGVATQDISRNVQQAAVSTREASQEAGEVTKSANETGEAASQMTAATTELSRQAEKLRSEVEKFLSNVRSAA